MYTARTRHAADKAGGGISERGEIIMRPDEFRTRGHRVSVDVKHNITSVYVYHARLQGGRRSRAGSLKSSDGMSIQTMPMHTYTHA